MRPISITLPERHLAILDEMRRSEPGPVPNRSEAIRRLIERRAVEAGLEQQRREEASK